MKYRIHTFLFFMGCFLWSFLLNADERYIAGQNFILTLPETNDKKALSSWLEKTKPAGVMLLNFHFQQREKTKTLVTFLQQEAKKLGIFPLLISVDWEGGIVSRPNETGGFFSIPSPWSLATAGRSTCFLGGMLIGFQLREVGVNIDFAPSLDLFDPQNYILATRCFSENPQKVSEYGIAFANGLLSQGVVPVIKHFPGLSLCRGDTHFSVVDIRSDEKTLQQNLFPFDVALQEGLPCVMGTHARVKKFGDSPVSLSAKAVAYIREKNPKTLLITDDFCMEAVRHATTVEAAALRSILAGFNLIIYSGKPEEQIATLNMLSRLVSALPAKKRQFIKEQNVFVSTFKNYFLRNESKNITHFDEKKLSEFLAQRCVPSSCAYYDLHKKNVVMISVDLPKIRKPEKWFVVNEKSYLCQQFERAGIFPQEHILDPFSPQSIELLRKIILKEAQAPNTLFVLQSFFYADNVWNTIQTQWLAFLRLLPKKLLVISLGHPYESFLLAQAHIFDAQIFNLGACNKPLLDVVAHRLCAKKVQTGADQCIASLDTYLQNKRFGLSCHRCSVAMEPGEQKFLPDVLGAWAKAQKNRTKLAALFSPEHGLLGNLEAAAEVYSEKNSKWCCPVYSLHGKIRKPTKEMLRGLDVLLIDFQDVGVRCFTYLSTLKLALEAAAENKIAVIVLDRPNPLACWPACGPELNKNFESFLGMAPTRFLHGSTLGAIAHMINKTINADLRVIFCKNMAPDYFFSRQFIPPSPNLRSLDHILAYPMTVFLEGTNYSEGRGTEYPFMQFGAPWVDGKKLATVLNAKNLPGIYFEVISFVPHTIVGMAEHPKHQNVKSQGVFMHLYDHRAVQPMVVAKTILETLFTLYPQQSEWLKFGNHYNVDNLLGSDAWRLDIEKRRALNLR